VRQAMSLLNLFFCLFTAYAEWRVLNVPVADLRAIPQLLPLSYDDDSNEQTQVLFGECLTLIATNSTDWLQVEVPDQTLLINDTKFVPYPGFIETQQIIIPSGNYTCDKKEAFNLVINKRDVAIYKKSCDPIGCTSVDILLFLSMGTRLQQGNLTSAYGDYLSINLPNGNVGWVARVNVNFYIARDLLPTNRVKSLIETAYQVLGWVYFFGGRSSYDPRSIGQLTGIDCSGLVGLTYQTHGVILPRDANGQWYGSNHGPNVTIQDGTIFFFASSTTNWVHHAMLYIGNGYLIESNSGSTYPSSFNGTRLMPIETYFGVPVEKLQYGMKIGTSNVLYWGDYFQKNN